jgi:hypothetical protein
MPAPMVMKQTRPSPVNLWEHGSRKGVSGMAEPVSAPIVVNTSNAVREAYLEG